MLTHLFLTTHRCSCKSDSRPLRASGNAETFSRIKSEGGSRKPGWQPASSPITNSNELCFFFLASYSCVVCPFTAAAGSTWRPVRYGAAGTLAVEQAASNLIGQPAGRLAGHRARFSFANTRRGRRKKKRREGGTETVKAYYRKL